MKIAPILLKYDYGIKQRGESLEKRGFLPALQCAAEEVVPFWLEDNGLWDDKISLQDKIINFVKNENPDIVFFILMKDEITIDTIEYISEKYTTVNWFCDDNWRFDSFTRFIAPKLTYSITTDKFSMWKYNFIGCQNVILSQWASFDYVQDINFEHIEYKYDISFVGAKTPVREWIFNSLKKIGYKVECFGTGWDNGRIDYEDIQDIFLHTRINLNLSNSINFDVRYLFSSIKNFKDFLKSKKRAEQIKARNFEIPCLGGFQLTNYVPGIEAHYDIGKDIAIFTSIDDLELQLQYYLNNEDKRKQMTISAYKKAKNYTYKQVISKVFKELDMYEHRL